VRLLRFLLPLCVVAASVVALQGLFRVVGQPTGRPGSQQPASLDLGAVAAARPVIAPVSPRPAPSPVPRRVPAPRPSPGERLTRPVVVFNASGITGLAGRTAGILRSRGVSVAAVGNLGPRSWPSTPTVYYPPGGRGQAQTLASLAGAKAVSPAPASIRPDGRLILVVTGASTASGT
jgi:hypothetical protein